MILPQKSGVDQKQVEEKQKFTNVRPGWHDTDKEILYY